MQLRYLVRQELVTAAGGDPWKLDETIQSGSPGEIGELATTFYNAGVCIGETSDEFNQAKKRFEDAWDRDDGGAHPINDSAEVQRATESLHLDREQLARISVDLQKISASLAEAQKTSAASISSLETSLQQIDNAIDAAVTQNGLVLDENDLAPLKSMAVPLARWPECRQRATCLTLSTRPMATAPPKPTPPEQKRRNTTLRNAPPTKRWSTAAVR